MSTNSRNKFILGAVVLLVMGLFVGNWVYGNSVAKKMDRQLQLKLANANLPVSFTYEDLTVNPLFSKVKLQAVAVTDPKSQTTLTCEGLDIDIPYDDALELAQSNKFEELKAFKLMMDNVAVKASAGQGEVSFGDVVIDFDGYLTKADIEQMDEVFPEEDQHLTLSFSDMKVQAAEIYRAYGFTPEQADQFSTIDKALFSFAFRPGKNKLEIEEVSVSSPILAYQMSAQVDYSGTGLEHFRANNVDVAYDCGMVPSSLEWGNPSQTGRFSLANLKASFDGSVSYNKEKGFAPNMGDSEFSFLLEGLKAEFTGRKKAELEAQAALLGIGLDELRVDKFAFNSSVADNRLTIKDTELETSLLKAYLSADVQMDSQNPDNSVINEAKLVIKDLTPELDARIGDLEIMFNKKIPREGSDIVLEITGSINKPVIKGLAF
ncbi:hypothetical protein DMA11_21120 [Marinilabiliaceae bacterium JC017]|nr:hypothetical protein DMA11_21120 [Marinilabiliaceae bacterium JC017]